MITAEISEARTPSGRLKEGWYEIFLAKGDGDLHYLRLHSEELEAIYAAWAVKRLQVGDAGMRRMAEARRAGAEQAMLWEGA
jgi:hypothetical protein